jgi:hypothetical protein
MFQSRKIKWLDCISKLTPLQTHSYVSPSYYRWYNGENFNYSGGQNIAGSGNDVVENDTINLLID